MIKFLLAYESNGARNTVYAVVKPVIAVSPVECDYCIISWNKDVPWTSSLNRTKSQNLSVSLYPLAVVFAQSIEAMCLVENEDVVGAAPTGDAPTTAELSTMLLPTKVHLY